MSIMGDFGKMDLGLSSPLILDAIFAASSS